MKRILSFILALLLCCGFIVSCEKEEAPLESESSSSVEMPSQEFESSSQEHSSSEESSTKESSSSSSGTVIFKPTEERYWHVSPVALIGNYESFNYVVARESNLKDLFSTVRVINDYETARNFFTYWIDENEVSPLDEKLFEDYFVIAILRIGDIMETEGYYYTDFKKTENGYKIRLNVPVHSPKEYSDEITEFSFDFVFIPRSLCDGSPVGAKISVGKVIHYYYGSSNT